MKVLKMLNICSCERCGKAYPIADILLSLKKTDFGDFYINCKYCRDRLDIENLTDYELRLMYDLKQTLESALDLIVTNHMTNGELR